MVVAGDVRAEPGRRDLSGAQHMVGDHRAVDGQGQGGAHPHVIQRRLRAVEAVEVRAQVGHGVVVGVAQQVVDLARRHARHPVQAAILVLLVSRLDVVVGQRGDAVQQHMGMVPVVLAGDHHQAFARLPFLQAEGAVAEEAALLGPALAVARDALHRHRHQGREGAQVEEVGAGIGEMDEQGMRIGDAHPEIGHGVVVEMDGLGVLHRVELIGIERAGGRGQDALPAGEEVRRGQGGAIRPARLRPQVEGVVQAV